MVFPLENCQALAFTEHEEQQNYELLEETYIGNHEI